MSEGTLQARLAQLEQAKSIVEADATYFLQIVLGVLSVFDDPYVEVRQWVAAFVLMAFSSTRVPDLDKQKLALSCLKNLASSLSSEKDVTVTKSFIQISTIIYPLLFGHVAQQPQAPTWELLSLLKRTILSYWDSEHEGLRLNCLKFAQCIVVVQSTGSKDPRLVDKSDISLNLVTPNHPFLNERDLTAEAQALLDRLIAVPQDRPDDATLMTASMNCLCVLAKRRTIYTSKIVNAILTYEQSQVSIEAPTTKTKLQARFVEKTIRLTLTHLLKNGLASQQSNKIQSYLANRARKPEEDRLRKRQASEAVETAGKRPRIDSEGPETLPRVLPVPALPDGLVNLATIFNLANDNALASFDVNQLPGELVVKIVLATLATCGQDELAASVKAVRDRYEDVQSRPLSVSIPSATTSLNPGVIVKDESEHPNVGTNSLVPASAVTGPFVMPMPRDQSQQELHELARIRMSRLLGSQSTLIKMPSLPSSVHDYGLQKVIGATWNKETWQAIVTRICSRGLCCTIRNEDRKSASRMEFMRNQLLAYVMTNFRENIDFCASWMNEEWYAHDVSDSVVRSEDTTAYHLWCNKVLDAILPFLESKDRLFMRFLSDLPDLSASMIDKIRTLCVDPDRAQLGYSTLQYLIMLRPPVRGLCLDLVEALHAEDSEFIPEAGLPIILTRLASEALQQEKILQRWRPGALVKTEATA